MGRKSVNQQQVQGSTRAPAKRGTWLREEHRTFVDDFSNGDGNYQDYEVVVRINKQNLDISGVVRDGTNDLDVSTGDQTIMFECANDGRRTQ